MNLDMQSLLEEMSALLEKIKAGNATMGELEAFAAAASQLNERAIVLRYKAYEAKVFGTELNEKSVAIIEDLAEDGQLDNFTIEEVMTPEEVSNTDSSNESSFSFDLFDNENEVEDEEEEIIEIEDEVELEEAKIEKPIFEEKKEEPLFNETKIEPVIAVEPTPQFETSIEEVKVETPSSTVISSDLHPIYNRVPTDMNSLSARIWQVRIESLRGAFGFNERMQAVNELFQGSLEAFTSAIDELDGIQDKASARARVSALANQYSWTAESEIGLDFVQKVERKYA